MKEIVAFKIGDYITNDPKEVVAAMDAGTPAEPLDRRHMQLMAALDLGIQWENLAKSRTLFRIDDAGELLPPVTGVDLASDADAAYNQRKNP